VTDLPLIKAAKLWAKVSARTGATYLTGRWCQRAAKLPQFGAGNFPRSAGSGDQPAA
jgi:hypothetical protein